jgi:mannitol PTS system EIICBA or EIICB component
MIIHFLGGIHEIYFPYVLMNPLLLAAAIAGGATGVFTFVLLDAGLVAPPSPGSIFALSAMASGDLIKVWVGIATSAAVSFFVASVIYKFTEDKKELAEAKAESKANKG